ncbi:hypothetical protein [Micromonospora zhanjiangensis]|uniref:Phosphoribosyl transferase domain-containing protein n=1 Tax=Micromonospora zhanjiangensis TaxID=1522057 RepID=A0ABV8KTG4_9ACTN
MIADTGSSRVESIADKSDVSGLHLVHNEQLEALLFDRNLTGLAFRQACFAASRQFVRHVRDDLDTDEIAELMILSKGLIYQLAEAVAVEVNRNLPTNLVSTTRLEVTSDDATVEVPYARFDAGGSTLLIGDTVASGATIVAALREYQKFHVVRRVYVMSYAGALQGAARIAGYCAENAIECTMLFGLAAFGLAENGFDLSFLNPATLTRDEYRQRAWRQFNGRPVSSVGWDFGSQAMAPGKYRQLCWMEAEIWGLHGSPGLSIAKAPGSMDVLAHEAAAYASRVPTVGSDQSASRAADHATSTNRSGDGSAAVGVDHPGVR